MSGCTGWRKLLAEGGGAHVLRVLAVLQEHGDAVGVISVEVSQNDPHNGFLGDHPELCQDFLCCLRTLHGVDDDDAILSFYHDAVS